MRFISLISEDSFYINIAKSGILVIRILVCGKYKLDQFYTELLYIYGFKKYVCGATTFCEPINQIYIVTGLVTFACMHLNLTNIRKFYFTKSTSSNISCDSQEGTKQF